MLIELISLNITQINLVYVMILNKQIRISSMWNACCTHLSL